MIAHALCHTQALFWLAALLAIISNISFGTSWVFYNSFLPVLTRHHPDVKDAYENKDKRALSVLSEKTSNLLSTTAFAFGYLGGILAFAIAFGTIVLMGPKLYSQQVGISTTGVWWLVFMALPLLLLKSRPGLPLPAGENFFLYSYKRGILELLSRAKGKTNTLN